MILKPNENVGKVTVRCFQKQRRDAMAAIHPKAILPRLRSPVVMEVTSRIASPIIYQYEWLGTMGRGAHHCGLFDGGELLGVVSFGWPSSPESRDICGRQYSDKAIAIERGACVHWAPKNSASYLIRYACQLISRSHGYLIFYAYSDEEAGEIGTVYQAANWLYIGQGVGRTPGRRREYFTRPDGTTVSSRSLRHAKLTKRQAVANGWTVTTQAPKHKYVWFEGSARERKELRSALRYAVLPYPKRATVMNDEESFGDLAQDEIRVETAAIAAERPGQGVLSFS